MGSQPYTAEDIAENKYSGSVLKSKYDIWKSNKTGKVMVKMGNEKIEMKRNQTSFALLLYPDKKNPQAQISKWLTGKSRIPSDKLDKIIDIFNHDGIKTSRDEFKLNKSEEYKYNADVVNDYIYKHYMWRKDSKDSVISEDFKRLDKFLQFLKTLPDYDMNFPLWTPIVLNDISDEKVIRDRLEKDKEYNSLSEADKNNVIKDILKDVTDDFSFRFKRDSVSNLPDFAPSDYPEFSVDKGADGIKVLQQADVLFIERVMIKVSEYINYLFKEREDQLIEDADRAGTVMQEYDTNNKDLTEKEKWLLDKDYYWYILSQRIHKTVKEGDEK